MGSISVSDYFVAWEENLIGFLASNIAHPFFVIEGSNLVGCLEYFDAFFDDSIPIEPMIVLKGAPLERLLEVYADLVRSENKLKVRKWNPVGWSRYQYFTRLRWEDVEKNLKVAQKSFPFEVFQIDDGYEQDIGDWMETKQGFPSLDEIAKAIKAHNFVPGIWTAPFSVSETSKLFMAHPDWAVADNNSPKECYKNWGKKIYALDTTHPEVKKWLFDTFSSLKKMGFKFFKIDFLFSAAMPGKRTKNVTPVQAYKQGLDVVREAVGNSFILGCGAPLLPSVGFVDGMRVAEDTAPFWNSRLSPFHGPNAYHAIKNAIMRQFMHRKLWLNDADCLLLRSKDTELAQNERELYALVSGALDNMIIESDDLSLVDAGGRKLLDEAISLRGGRVNVYGLFEDGVYLIESKRRKAGNFKLAVNVSDEKRCLKGQEIPARTAVFLERETKGSVAIFI